MQDTVIAQELTQAWQALTRQDGLILAGHLPLPTDSLALSFWLPIFRDPGMAPAVVMLWLSQAEAESLASAMFGLAPDHMSPADVHDASGELCNIFASVLSRPLRAKSSTELGLPQAMSTSTYLAALKGDASSCHEFSSPAPHGLHVCLLDPAPLLFPPREA